MLAQKGLVFVCEESFSLEHQPKKRGNTGDTLIITGFVVVVKEVREFGLPQTFNRKSLTPKEEHVLCYETGADRRTSHEERERERLMD